MFADITPHACLLKSEHWTLHAGVQEMLAVAEKMDLSQNVFQDGTWGTLRYEYSSIYLHLGVCWP